ncbi:MAG: hypothetical protein ABEJ04_02490 [Halobacteriaceae archaeon]
MADVTPARDERAASVTVGYVVSLAVVALVVSALLVATGTFVQGKREQVVRTELRVVGEQVASDLAAADRLAETGATADARVRSTLPESVAGLTYRVRVVDRPDGGPGPGNRYALVLRTDSPAVTVNVTFVTDATVQTGTTVTGGPLVVVYDGTDLEVRERE